MHAVLPAYCTLRWRSAGITLRGALVISGHRSVASLGPMCGFSIDEVRGSVTTNGDPREVHSHVGETARTWALGWTRKEGRRF